MNYQTHLHWMQTRIRKALRDFNLIEPGDRIAVGISGGKDSAALLFLLANLQKFRGFDFSLFPIHVAPGWDGLGLNPPDLSALEAFCADLSLHLHREETQIAEIVFVARAETNPCSLCAKMRRGALHNAALALNCNKVALGHHADDVVETFFLNLFYTGKLSTFSPRTYLSKKNLVLIRPMVYLAESAVQTLATQLQLPVIANPCPSNGHTKREEIKQLVKTLEVNYPDLRGKLLTSLGNLDLDEIWNLRKNPGV